MNAGTVVSALTTGLILGAIGYIIFWMIGDPKALSMGVAIGVGATGAAIVSHFIKVRKSKKTPPNV